MNDQKDQVVQKLQAASNILVTVHSSPTVDQLSAAIALTLVLNKMGKHATAVFSGAIPSVIEFLKPEETIEKNTDSLRDFIVALDKAKADKLKYKVEDEVVKIFITPYKSSISEKDLIFSQGDFNVDVVMALGVHQQQDLDAAITAHGRILHDAAVITVNNSPEGELGSINWLDPTASGLSEMITGVATDLGENLLDSQIATALLTGVVAETEHFRNARTTPHTMTISATLLASGANQQLVADQLDMAPGNSRSTSLTPMPENTPKPEDGTLKVDNSGGSKKGKGGKQPAAPQKQQGPAVAQASDTAIAEPAADIAKPLGADPSLQALLEQADAEVGQPAGSTLPAPVALPTDNSPLPVIDLPNLDDIATQQPAEPDAAATDSADAPELPLEIDMDDATGKTLTEIEAEVQSPHLAEEAEPASGAAADDGVDSARKAVEDALKASSSEPMFEPLEALNAQPVDLDLGHAADGSLPESPAVPVSDATPLLPPLDAAPTATSAQAPDLLPYDPAGGQGNVPGPTPLPPQPLPTTQPLSLASPSGPDMTPMPPSPIGTSGPLGVPAFAPTPPAPQIPPAAMPPAGSAVPTLGPTGLGPLPPNPAVNEPAPLTMSPADQPFTMPLPPSGGLQVPPPQVISPTSTTTPPQGPPPPPVPPPFPPAMPR